MSHIEWLLDIAIKAGSGNWWWVATTYKTADIAFRRACDRLKGYLETKGKRKKVSVAIEYTSNKSNKTITVNGATVWFQTAEKPNNLYGEDVRGAVGDEISRWREAAFIALYTTLTATEGCGKFIGNVNGRHNFAYKLARKAKAGQPNWSYHKLTAVDAIEGGVMSADILKQAEQDLSAPVLQELYYAEASEDGTNPFNLKAITACIKPFSTLPPVAFGLDLARKRDWLVLIGLDRNGQVCRHERWTKFALWAEKEKEIIKIVGSTPVTVDSTSMGGDRVVEALNTGYEIDGVKRGCSNLTEYPFTETSRQQLMEGLEVAIQKGQISFPDNEIRAQLDSFEIEHTRKGVKYIAPDGMHDDDAIALALAREQYSRLNLRQGAIGNQQGSYAQSDIDFNFSL